MTAGEYLAWEREQERRHEFFDGEVFAMTGGTPRHNAICAAIVGHLGNALEGSSCRVFTSDQRVSVAFERRYVYPDATVVCGPMELEQGTRDVVSNPRVVVEVVSAGSEANDRGSKWDGYRSVASLHDYLLVSQTHASIEHYHRQDDGSWRYTAVGSGAKVTVAGAVLEVDRIYEGVFELPGDEAQPVGEPF